MVVVCGKICGCGNIENCWIGKQIGVVVDINPLVCGSSLWYNLCQEKLGCKKMQKKWNNKITKTELPYSKKGGQQPTQF